MWKINNVTQLIVTGVRSAYNPSALVLDSGEILLSYRNNLAPKHGAGLDHVEICFLDRDLNQLSDSIRLNLGGSWCEDARLVAVEGEVWLIYGRPTNDHSTWRQRRLGLAKLHVDTVKHQVDVIENNLIGREATDNECEKNWTPFAHGGRLFLSYSICPHVVLREKRGVTWVQEASSSRPIIWPSNYISGGTPAVPIDEGREYLGFFHGVSFPFDWLRTSRDNSQKFLSHTRYYTFGAYTFSAAPPFELLRASPHPLCYEGMFNVSNSRVSRDERVVFPSGLIIDDNIGLLVRRQTNGTDVAII